MRAGKVVFAAPGARRGSFCESSVPAAAWLRPAVGESPAGLRRSRLEIAARIPMAMAAATTSGCSRYSSSGKRKNWLYMPIIWRPSSAPPMVPASVSGQADRERPVDVVHRDFAGLGKPSALSVAICSRCTATMRPKNDMQEKGRYSKKDQRYYQAGHLASRSIPALPTSATTGDPSESLPTRHRGARGRPVLGSPPLIALPA